MYRLYSRFTYNIYLIISIHSNEYYVHAKSKTTASLVQSVTREIIDGVHNVFNGNPFLVGLFFFFYKMFMFSGLREMSIIQTANRSYHISQPIISLLSTRNKKLCIHNSTIINFIMCIVYACV